MIWLILFLPAVMVWAFVLFIHVKSGKSNHRYHEPLIFYSQRISPFRVEHSKTITKMKQKKLSKMIAFFYYYFTPLIKVSLYLTIFKQSVLKRIIRGGFPADYSFYFVGGSNFTPTSFDPPSLLTSCIILFASFCECFAAFTVTLMSVPSALTRASLYPP